MSALNHFINGRSVPPASGQYLDVFEPATGRVYAKAAAGNKADIDAAVAAAAAAFPAWSHTPAIERSRILMKLADLLDARAEDFVVAESRDTGKPRTLARAVDIPRAALNLRFFATAILHSRAETYETEAGAPSPGKLVDDHAVNYVLRKPRGVAGLISPWNLPLYLLTWKIGPALATGNTAVCKPSEVTPLTASMLGELVNEAGIPAGVLNIVQGTGPDAGGPLVEHPDVPTISFTGSTGVGKWIGAKAGGMLKRVSLELGGKNAFVVFDDCDLNEAADLATRAAFSNQGQICLCGSRLLVQRPLFEKMRDAVTARAKGMVVGDPNDPGTHQGSLVSKAHRDKVASMVDKARSLGATIHAGGSPATELPDRCKEGYFYKPTVMTGLDPRCAVEQEEIFGPVVSMTPFDTEEEAINIANGTQYGLAATVMTRDAARAQRVGAAMDAGIIWVNCWLLRDLRTPFGGMKQSGVGREGGDEALKFFTEARNVCVKA